VWAQIKAALNGPGKPGLSDDVLHSWFLDPAIRHRADTPTGTRSDEPLFIETPGLWDRRPEPATGIPNLFLAADYVRNASPIDAATMDGANAAARAAVNALLDATGARTDRVPIYTPYTAPEFAEAKELDARRYASGEPHVLDTTGANGISEPRAAQELGDLVQALRSALPPDRDRPSQDA
jgi:hypothetical protein